MTHWFLIDLFSSIYILLFLALLVTVWDFSDGSVTELKKKSHMTCNKQHGLKGLPTGL